MNELVVYVDGVEYHAQDADPVDPSIESIMEQLESTYSMEHPTADVRVAWRS